MRLLVEVSSVNISVGRLKQISMMSNNMSGHLNFEIEFEEIS